MSDTPEDNRLMERVRQGELAGLAALFERHHRPLFQYFNHLCGNPDLSRDLVQEVFFRMLKYKDSFQAGGSFPAWMYQIARHTHVDTMRKRRFEVIPGGVDSPFPEPASREEAPDDRLSRRQQTELLRRALNRLPPEKREVLVLSRFQNLRYEQIAEILDCEVGTVKVRVFRAVRALGEIYSELARQRAC